MTHARSNGSQAPVVSNSRQTPALATGAMTPFDGIYDQPDPRAYFRELRPWEYQTPHHAQPVFRRMLTACRPAGPATVLDLCCSYGINAALLNHELTLEDLYAHYTSPQATELTTAELIEWDRAYYAAHRRPDPARVIGLDAAPHAVSYARAVGLLDEGFAENLETAPPSPALRQAARHTRLITVTGGASFLTPLTFEPLLDCVHGPVWVAAFVLRTHSYRRIAECLEPYGLRTEKARPPHVSATPLHQRAGAAVRDRRGDRSRRGSAGQGDPRLLPHHAVPVAFRDRRRTNSPGHPGPGILTPSTSRTPQQHPEITNSIQPKGQSPFSFELVRTRTDECGVMVAGWGGRPSGEWSRRGERGYAHGRHVPPLRRDRGHHHRRPPVATGCGQIKTGSLTRADRTTKSNQLVRIEEELGRPRG